MKKYLIAILLAVTPVLTALSDVEGNISTSNVSIQHNGKTMAVSMDFVLDSLRLPSNSQLLLTPYLEGAEGDVMLLPTLLVNGRNMHYVYQRQGLSKQIRENYKNVYKECARKNRTEQSVEYSASVPTQPWMKEGRTVLRLATDTCGCGAVRGRGEDLAPELASWNETGAMRIMPKFLLAFIVPPVTEQPVAIHEGKARVQFEVDKTELHTVPYTCKSGQKIDNRQQLQIICDSIDYALSDPNVEIANINICGYASPESPYDHNDYLATNRSRSLAEYIGQRYQLPQERCTYSSVPENWAEFREQVLSATDITEKQRQDLLELIDKPTYGSADFDAKEKALKTDPRYAKLYKTKIHPVWFPELRCTKFAISTRLKPTSDERLAEIIKTTPELLSLNQMFRVARLYEEGSEEFNQVFEIALRVYKDDPVANTNAAVAAIKSGNYQKAEELLQKAGDSQEAENARGVVAAHKNDMNAAAEHFQKASRLHEAKVNLEQIKQ